MKGSIVNLERLTDVELRRQLDEAARERQRIYLQYSEESNRVSGWIAEIENEMVRREGTRR